MFFSINYEKLVKIKKQIVPTTSSTVARPSLQRTKPG